MAKSVHVILSLHAFYIVIHILKWVRKTAKKLSTDTGSLGRTRTRLSSAVALSPPAVSGRMLQFGRTVLADSSQRILLTPGLGGCGIPLSQSSPGRMLQHLSDQSPSRKMRTLATTPFCMSTEGRNSLADGLAPL